MVSEAWKALTPEERKPWDDRAKQDKARYEIEKSTYNGPWKVPANRRALKDENAPKRPPSAFLAYSQVHRNDVRAMHPDYDNIAVSRILARMWKEAPQEEKQPFIDREAELRAEYKVAMGEWRRKEAEEQAAVREEREAAALEQLKSLTGSTNQEEQPTSALGYTNPSLEAAVASSLLAASPFRNAPVAPQLQNAAAASYPSAHGYAAGVSSAYSNPYDQSLLSNALLARAAVYNREQEQQQAIARAYARAATYNNPLTNNALASLNPFSNSASLYQRTAATPASSSLATSLLAALSGTTTATATSAEGVFGKNFVIGECLLRILTDTRILTPFACIVGSAAASTNAYPQGLYARVAGLSDAEQLQQASSRDDDADGNWRYPPQNQGGRY